MKRKFNQIKKFCLIFAKSNAGTHAAAASYYILLSIPSFLILAASTLPYFPALFRQIEQFISVSVPTEFLPVLSPLLGQFQSSGATVLLPITFFVVLWSSSKGASAVLSGLYAAFQLPNNNFVVRRLHGMLLIILVCLGLIVLHYFTAASYIFFYFSAQPGSLPKMIFEVISKYRIAIEFPLLFFLFSICYKYIYKQQRISQVIISASAAAIGWILISRCFSVYIRWSISQEKIISALNVLFIGTIWLRFSMMIFFYGAVFDNFLVNKEIRLFHFTNRRKKR